MGSGLPIPINPTVREMGDLTPRDPSLALRRRLPQRYGLPKIEDRMKWIESQ